METERRERRRLAAILAADLVGYSRLLAEDEAATLEVLRGVWAELLEPLVAAHGGRVFAVMGDGFLAEFPSSVLALRCALALQEGMAGYGAGRPNVPRLAFRVGVHQGEVVEEGDGVTGDGVNIAVRLEALAEPGGVCVSARVCEDAAGKLALDAEDRGEQALKNIPRPVRVFRVRGAGPRPTPSAVGCPPTPARRDRPSLAVLPFVSLGGDPEQEYFADGMVDDLITALSRIRWFFVIARNSAFTYRGRAVPAPQVGRELGVRYVVEGAIRRAAGQVRVNVEVVEAESGTSVWANRFDGAEGDVFALQDRIVASVVGAVEPSLRRAELERVRRRRPTEQPDAYEAYWRASAALRTMTAANCALALGFLDQALAADPSFPLALAAAACCRGWRVSQAFEPSGDAGDAAQAIAQAEAAVAAGPDDPTVLAQVGLVFAFLGHRRLAALTFVERAVELHPNSALVRSAAGWVRLYQGDAEAALAHFAEAVRFDPLDPAVGEPLAGAAFAHLLADRVEEAVVWAERAVAANPDLASAQRVLAAALGAAARPEAAEAAARLLAGRPGFNLADYAHARTAHPTLLRVVSDGLRRAGVPECGPGFPQ